MLLTDNSTCQTNWRVWPNIKCEYTHTRKHTLSFSANRDFIFIQYDSSWFIRCLSLSLALAHTHMYSAHVQPAYLCGTDWRLSIDIRHTFGNSIRVEIINRFARTDRVRRSIHIKNNNNNKNVALPANSCSCSTRVLSLLRSLSISLTQIFISYCFQQQNSPPMILYTYNFWPIHLNLNILNYVLTFTPCVCVCACLSAWNTKWTWLYLIIQKVNWARFRRHMISFRFEP